MSQGDKEYVNKICLFDKYNVKIYNKTRKNEQVYST